MTARLLSAQNVAGALAAELVPRTDGPPFATVSLTEDGRTYVAIDTAAEAYALRDAAQRAGDLLAGAEGAES